MGDFEKEMLRLEEISKSLQSGEQGLEKSMELYSEGIRLANALIAKLEKLKSKIEILETEAKSCD
jgi:exodeoxyribonuclease VII small subunit